MANIVFNDYGAAIDPVTVTEMLTKFTVFTLTSRITLTASFSSTFAAGLPVQAGVRQLATDRWNYMYPS